MRLSLRLAFIWVCLLGQAGIAHAAAEVRPLELAAGPAGTVLRVTLSQSSPYRLFTLDNPHRVVLDVQAARLSPAATPLPSGVGPVRQLRAANRLDGSVRIVLDVATALEPVGLVERDASSGRPVIRVTLSGVADPAPAVVGPAAPVAAAPAAPVTAEASGEGVAAAVAGPPAAPTAAPRAPQSQPAPRGRDIVIAIDAGHGGKDPGAHGPRGIREKDVTLRIARQLAAVVDREPGMRAVLTRSGDEFIPLRGRMERARAARADLFVSIHADAVANRKVRGASVYVLNEKGATDEAARRLAARENAADLIGGVSLKEHDRTLASVLLDLSQGAALSSSIDVAGDILNAIASVGTVRKPHVMQAPFMVLKSPDVPSVLVETAYISNPDEEARLSDAGFRSDLATAILAGVRNYFYRNPPEGSLVAALAARRLADGASHRVQPGESLTMLAGRYGTSVARLREFNALPSDRLVSGMVLRIPPRQET